MFRPWIPAAFPVWDYADLIPLLRQSSGFWSGVEAVASFNRADGRANYLSYVQFALTWALAGENPVVWQLQRAGFMLVAALLLVAVARRLGATPLASGVAALLFTVTVPSTEGWLFLMGEPLALILLLLMVLVGAGFRVAPAWKGRGVALALLAALVMLTKEFLGILLPVAVLFAACWDPDRGFLRPNWSRREAWLALLLGAVLALELWSVISALGDAVPGSYAMAYGRAGFDGSRAGTLFQGMLLPARFSSAGGGTNLYPANVAFLLVLVLGLARPANPGLGPRNRVAWLVVLLSIPLFGAAAYGFWPRYSAFYGIPFGAGSMGLFLAAGSAIEHSHRLGRWVILILGGIGIVYTSITAVRVVGEKHGLASLALAISHTFPRAPRLDTVFVVTPRQGGRRWPVTGRELRRYALAVGIPDSILPVMLDASCEEVGSRLSRPLGRNAILNDQNSCGRLPERTHRWQSVVRSVDWLSLGWRSDTVVVELLAPNWRSSSPSP